MSQWTQNKITNLILMKNQTTITIGVILVIIFGFMLLTFQVRHTEVAIRTTFGKAVVDSEGKADIESGFHFRWPWPVNEVYKFEKTVIASGAFSKKLTDQLGENIPLDTERGYHVHFKDKDKLISRPVIFLDRGFGMTPMNQGLRAVGTVELGGLKNPCLLYTSPSPRDS